MEKKDCKTPGKKKASCKPTEVGLDEACM